MDLESTQLTQAIVKHYAILNLVSAMVATLIYVGQKSKLTQLNLLYWLSVFVSFGLHGVAGEDPTAASFSILPTLFSVWCATGIMESIFGFVAPRKLQIGIAVALIAAALISLAAGVRFEIHASFNSLAVALPLLLSWVYAVKSGQKLTPGRIMFLVTIFLSFAHILDYPFLRLSKEYQLLGFTLAYWNGFLNAIVFPVSIVEAMRENYTEQLEHDVKVASGELLLRNEQLQKSEIEKTNIVRIVCHDLSSSLMLADSSIQILHSIHTANRSKDESDQKTYEMLEKHTNRIKTAVRNEIDLVENVKNYLAVISGKAIHTLYPCNLHEALADSLALLETQFQQKNLVITCSIPSDLYVRAETTTLRNSVIGNILSNAMKFSYIGGKLDISAEALQGNSQILLRITDYGVGIRQERMDSLFESGAPTSTRGTKGEYGTGFGMPIAKSVCDRFGAQLEIVSISKEQNDSDHGTEVLIYFEQATKNINSTSEPGKSFQPA